MSRQTSHNTLLLFLLLLYLSFFPCLRSQTEAGSGPAKDSAGKEITEKKPAPKVPEVDDCEGMLLTYNIDDRKKIHPYLKKTNPAAAAKAQPYAFSATANVINYDTIDLVSWELLVTFGHREILVSVYGTGALTDGYDLPYKTSTSDQPVSFSGFPEPDLLTPIETADNIDKIQANISLVGTVFGGTPDVAPLPTGLSLANPAFICQKHKTDAKFVNFTAACCKLDPNFKNVASLLRPNESDPTVLYRPRSTGDLIIDYSAIQASNGTYLVQVTIENNATLARIDGWRLTWEWKHGEFIYSMKGAYPSEAGVGECLYGRQGKYYRGLDFTKVLNCQRNVTIYDYPPWRYNDTDVGGIPFCCRNGTLMPKAVNASESKSGFQVLVFKMPPENMKETKISPPENFRISGSSPLNPEYLCGPPVRVAPSEFPDLGGLSTDTTAVATWQVVCNVKRPPQKAPKCCVSFSAYYDQSVVPCRTCACGCPTKTDGANTRPQCNANARALPLPPEALLRRSDNRTDLALTWCKDKHFDIPDPMPCGDNCGLSINWHLSDDHRNDWSARMTVFNWDNTSYPDWFAAVKLDKAYAGYEKTKALNGTAIGGHTILFRGVNESAYLIGRTNESESGKQQAVIAFTKAQTPLLDLAGGDGFPLEAYFNGEKCAMPDRLPKKTSGSWRGKKSPMAMVISAVIAVTLLILFLV